MLAPAGGNCANVPAAYQLHPSALNDSQVATSDRLHVFPMTFRTISYRILLKRPRPGRSQPPLISGYGFMPPSLLTLPLANTSVNKCDA